MIGFANPSFFWAFAAIGLPLAIHLFSPHPGKVILVGSLRHLPDSFSRQLRSIRLNEILLLILRTLLIILLVLIASGITWNSAPERTEKWVLFEKGLERDPKLSLLRDSLEKAGYKSHFLYKGFPGLPDSISVGHVDNYQKLATEIANAPVNDAIIFSYFFSNGFRGKLMTIPSNQHWVPQDHPQVQFLAGAVSTNGDSLQVRMGTSNSHETSFTTTPVRNSTNALYYKSSPEQKDSVRVTTKPILNIAIAYDSIYQRDKVIILAAIKAIEQSGVATLNVTSSTTEKLKAGTKEDWLIWLSDNPTKSIQHPHIIHYSENTSGPLLQQISSTEWLFNKGLTKGIALNENLPVQLLAAVIPDSSMNDEWKRKDVRMVESSLAWKSTVGNAQGTAVLKTAFENILVILFLTLLIVERIISYSKKQ